MHGSGSYVGDNGNHAQTAHGKQGHDLIVIAGVKIDIAVCQRHQFDDLADVAAGFLDADNAGDLFDDPGRGLRLDVAAGAAGNIVHDDRDIGAFSDCLVMGIEAVLGALVVIGSHDQQSVRTGLSDFGGELNGRLGAVGACAGYDRDPAVDIFDAPFTDLDMLLLGQGRGLACCTANNNTVGPVVDLIIDKIGKSVVIDTCIFMERCDDRDCGSFEY